MWHKIIIYRIRKAAFREEWMLYIKEVTKRVYDISDVNRNQQWKCLNKIEPNMQETEIQKSTMIEQVIIYE